MATDRVLGSIVAPFGERELTASLVHSVGHSEASWDIVLHLDGFEVVSGGYRTGHLGDLSFGELGPRIGTDLEDEQELMWEVSAEAGRSADPPLVERRARTWVARSEDGYWVAITLEPSVDDA